ncbi:MAG: radical SAM protein [Thermoplasmata archaeon]|nr:radical SAM protein [Thermoplasmata archaeon]
MTSRSVKPFYDPPSLIFKQLKSALMIRRLTGWSKLPWWAGQADKIFRIAAGCQGIGCFGYPVHPVFEITARCNLKCDHCHASGGESDGSEELSTGEIKTRVIDSLAQVEDFKSLIFSGGEPLLRDDLFELIRYSRERGFYPIIATNATLITEDVAQKLKKSGNIGIAASIDSMRDDVHDAFRGMDGALRMAREGIRNASDAGMYVQINITASKINQEELPDIISFADNLRAHVILLYQFIPSGRGEESSELEFSKDEFRNEILLTSNLQRDIHPVIAPVGLPQYWALQNVMKNAGEKSDVVRGCICGNGMFYIKPNGDVWPCAFVPLSGGNLKHQTAKEIWENSELFVKLRDRSNLKGICHDCNQREMCGGCRARSYAHTGDLFSEDPKCPLKEEERIGKI